MSDTSEVQTDHHAPSSTDTATAAATDTPTLEATKRGRKPAVAIIDKIAALKAQLAEAEARAKIREKECALVVGAVVIQSIRQNSDLRSTITALLRDKVKNPKEKSLVAELLGS